MATTRKTTTKRKTATRKRAAASASKEAEIKVMDGRLVVRLSKEQHPEVFETDKLLKDMVKIRTTYSRKRKCRDLIEFLSETEKSLEILLRNHLEEAMRMYLK